MNSFCKTKHCFLTILIFTIIIIMTGCSKNDKDPSQISTLEKERKAPEGLNEIESEIKNIIETLDKDINNEENDKSSSSKSENGGDDEEESDESSVQEDSDKENSGKSEDNSDDKQNEEGSKESDKDKKEDKDKEEGKGKEEGNDSGELGDESEKGDSNKSEDNADDKTNEGDDKLDSKSGEETSDKELKKETFIERRWKSVSTKVTNVHKQWNSLQAELIKGAAPKKTIDDFSNTLNQLTIYVDSHDMQNCLFSANNLYKLVPDFMEQYNNKVPPDLKRLGYFIRDAKYNGMINDWDKANSSMENLKSHWPIIKAQTNKDEETQAGTMESSINELEKVIQQSNIKLTAVKSDIALDNLKKLEKSFQKNNKGKK